ncbi:uncharacterized protein SPSK_04422 [Sporothrix schenckii 1099-18]|uniref:DUF1996 domain-containing protein n=2 Tax=Sporothrix schenckii TaxID=29908 RepID=U7PTT9_SPOS1|nr:uncharacterized protein SPSK_04422 [Sporothrix schenckii 1099-18]ERS98997.1 hypothetical protein HMPREF1624_04192 [Sporothrix schenckii ATCC 58251]KJR83356.1 hypothetical protein SPSK_04422 [Sporothrix schenckii 1099-18]
MKSAAITAVVGLLAQSAAAQNMLRFACSQLVVERTDPIVNPGEIYTPHLHQIVGGNSFNVTMDPASHDLPGLSTCTSCNFKEDLSNYWTAVLFFKAKNGTFRRVPQVGNGGPQGQLVNKGGLDVYYIPSGKVTAFKPGFRMIAGKASNTDTSKVNKGNICHRCWKSTNDNQFTGGAPCTGSDTVDVPTDQSCKMVRQTIIFPTCWDGKNLDSPDHQSHVAYSGAGASGGGACPSSHPTKLPQIMYELMWNTSSFMDKSIWPTDGSNPFIYSMNIGGAAAHGDYVFGWKDKSLQLAMDHNCNLNKDCSAAGLHALSPDVYSACTKKQQAPEDVDGWLKALPMGEMAMKA